MSLKQLEGNLSRSNGMKTILLDGTPLNDPYGESVHAALLAELHKRGWEVQTFLLREKNIGNCVGDFFCWVRSPGICNVDDDNRLIAAAIANSDLLVYLTPVTFGGYSSALKRIVDHQIQNILPFFAKVEGEVHHQKRYAHYPDFLAIGWLDAPDTQAEAIFRHLVDRNRRNFYARTSIAGLVYTNQGESGLRQAAQGWLADLERGLSSPVVELPALNLPGTATCAPQKALLLVGSPRTRESTSNSLGSYLLNQLEAHGVQVEAQYIYTTLRSKERWSALLQALDTANLVLLAFPLYVDTLPAPVIEALERIASHRAAQVTLKAQRFAAIINCGFPEVEHMENAQAVCAQFAHQTGLEWAGALALAGGEGLVHGAPLAELDGRAIPMKKSLDLAALALAQGESIPQVAADLLARPVIPGLIYQVFGSFGWKKMARRYGAEKQIRNKPYLKKQ
jgi:multimeric flavodoxin WrbA